MIQEWGDKESGFFFRNKNSIDTDHRIQNLASFTNPHTGENNYEIETDYLSIAFQLISTTLRKRKTS